MAYLVFNVKGRELGRRPLDERLVIGRSPDCDVCVHDIVVAGTANLSRLPRVGLSLI